jgi:hypothetical protein
LSQRLHTPAARARRAPSNNQMLTVSADRLTFVHDVHYQLHLENHGRETHEFTAPTFFATADIDNPNALNQLPHRL